MIVYQTKLIEHVGPTDNRRRSRRLSTGREGSSRAVFAKTMLDYYQHRLVLYYFVMVDRFSAIVGKVTVVATLNNMPSIFPRAGSGEGGM
ncbi:hypothetical protein KY284_027449 [Solanum tuberosum]|nr:hypothetical protein KY284_027449 [Solanum tuberosum]